MFRVLYFLFTLCNLIKEQGRSGGQTSADVVPQSFGKWGCTAAAAVTVRLKCWKPVCPGVLYAPEPH